MFTYVCTTTTLHNLEKDNFCDKHICQIILFIESYVPMPAWLLAPDSSLPKPTPLYLVIPTQPQSGHPSSIFNAIWTLADGVLRQGKHPQSTSNLRGREGDIQKKSMKVNFIYFLLLAFHSAIWQMPKFEVWPSNTSANVNSSVIL